MTGNQEEPVPAPGATGSHVQSSRPLNLGRLWAGGLATSVVAMLIALVGVLVVRAILRIAGYTPSDPTAFGGLYTVVLCVTAGTAALLTTELAYLLVTTTPRPLTYLSWIVGLATAVAVVVPLVAGASLALALGQALINLVVGSTIGTLIIIAVRASRPPYPVRRVGVR